MKYKNNTDLELLIRIIEGKANPSDKKLFDGWLNQSEKNILEYETLKSLWKKTGSYETPEPPNPDFMWNSILFQINRSYYQIKNGFDFTYVVKIAAVILVVISGVIFYNHIKESSSSVNTNKQISDLNSEIIVNDKLIAHNGEKITCVLPDSSVVHLNSESRLDYPEYFSGSNRIVNLIGEAYFSVKHDKNRPFIVKTGNSQVTVTGTEFNIRNRNNNTKIVVAKGSVNVLSFNTRKQENLKKGDMVQLDDSGNITQPIQVDLKYYLAWRENKLAFKKTPLKEVMAEIERTYNVKSEFLKKSSENRTITGIFETDSLERVLSVLSLTLDLNISQKGTKIIIH
ncbi:MAG: FecR domain-containing protein [Ignavibacteriaceae bacterium]|nr:FecR domain-containing protein [Ignavibacteriaceae bacterium]